MSTRLAELGPNKIINGDFSNWQRNTTATLTTTGLVADRMKLAISGSYNVTVSQDTFLPLNSSALYSMKVTNNTIVTPSASNYLLFVHTIEGHNIRSLKKKYSTVSFQIYTPFTGYITASLNNSGNGKYFLSKVNCVANTWTKIVIPVDILPTDSGVWNFNTNAGLNIDICLSCGTSYQSLTENQWLDNGSLILSLTGQKNFADTIGNTVYITELAYHEGVDPIPFNKLVRDPMIEQLLCYRYYQQLRYTFINGTLDNKIIKLYYKQTMRTYPTVVRLSDFYSLNESGTSFGSVDLDGMVIANTNYAVGGQFIIDAEF